MASIKLENISKSFGRTRVIHDITLDIKDGELDVFVGPSGCGKSTLLRMISGLEEQSGGDIHIGDRLVNTVPPQDRRVAMVFQNYALYPHMTVEQNISFRLRLKKVPKPDRDKAVAEAARILGLEDLLHRKPRELSGGQRQRVAMGRAIVRNPDVFLMDEPLSNLDAKLRNHMRVEIKQLQRRLGTTTVYVTHDQVEAMTMADRIVILDQGRVAQFATPDQVYYQPENIFVADFIGAPAMNFIPAKRTSQTELTLEGGLTMSLSQARQEISEEKLTVGIRPEHVAIAPEGEPLAPELVSWRTSVRLNEPLGGESLLHTALEDAEIQVKRSGRELLPEGAAITLAFLPEQAHIFSAETGRNLGPATAF